MRLRKKWWARPELESSNIFVNNPRELKGKWKQEFKNNNPIHLELGCGRGGFLVQKALKHPDINHIAVDLKDEVLVYALRKVKEVEPEIKNARIVALNISFIADLFEKDEITKYAVPQEYLVTKGRLKKLDGNLYELVPSEDKIEIYLLAEKNFDGNELESYVLDAE